MTVGSLCAGIGGFDLGFERAGMTVRWQVEIDPFCRKVLAKHWPDVKRYEDLTTLTGDELAPVDLVCAGFPCQPVSVAGSRKGQADERWIWPHIARLLGVLRPRWVVLENTPGLLTANSGHAFGEVIGDLAAIGFDAEWEVLSAADVGAPHLRKRVWIVAHSKQPGDPTHGSVHRRDQGEPAGNARASVSAGTEVAHAENTQSCGAYVADAQIQSEGGNLTRPYRGTQDSSAGNKYDLWDGSGDGGEVLADTDGGRLDRIGQPQQRPLQSASGDQSDRRRTHGRFFDAEIGGEWEPEPNIRRISHGVRNRVDRLKGLGNAIVPQIAEWIGRRIIEVER
jgi:DNA (cytosine-5)-methyltransferase 1